MPVNIACWDKPSNNKTMFNNTETNDHTSSNNTFCAESSKWLIGHKSGQAQQMVKAHSLLLCSVLERPWSKLFLQGIWQVKLITRAVVMPSCLLYMWLPITEQALTKHQQCGDTEFGARTRWKRQGWQLEGAQYILGRKDTLVIYTTKHHLRVVTYT